MSPLEDMFGAGATAPPTPVTPLAPPAATAAPQRNLAPGSEFDSVRHGTVLERFLSGLALPSNAVAGSVDAAMRGEDPLMGARLGMAEHTTFGRILKQQGLNGPVAGALGLGLDIALDPLNYVGLGEISGLGKAAKAATMGLKVAEFGGDAARIAEHAAQVAKTGRYAETAAERARLGQQSILTFMGRPVVPRPMSAAVFEQTDKLWKAAGETDIAKSLGQVFQSVAKRAPEALRASYFANRAESAYLTRESIEQLVKPYQDEVKKLAKTSNVDYEVAASVVAHAVQTAKATGGMTDPVELQRAIDAGKQLFGGNNLDDQVLAKSVNAINIANAAILSLEQHSGLKISELTGSQNYLKRAITPEAREAMRAADPTLKNLSSRELSTEYGARLARDPALKDLTISEINEMAKNGQLSATGFKPVKEFFHEDPFVATALRLKEGHEAVADINFLKNAARIHGHGFAPGLPGAAGLPPAGMRTLTTKIADDLGLIGRDAQGKVTTNTAFPREVADLLDQHYEKVISPHYLQGFLSGWDKVQGVWKSLTLPIWPSYHTRNLLSDVWMVTSTPGGMPLWRLPERMAQAGRAMMGSGNGSIRLGNRWFTYDDLKTLAEQVGVTQQGVGRDFQELVQGPLARKATGLDMITASKPIQMAAAVGNARENMTRMSYFIERLARGEAPEVAALEVKKRLFDYGDLSDVERQVLRRVFPFYSWARNNIPFQLQHLLRSPGYGARLEKIRSEAATVFGENDLGQGTTSIPPFLQRGMPLPLGRNVQGQPRFARLQNIIPIADVSQVSSPAAVAQTVIDQFTPLIKAPVESAANIDLFRSDLPAGKLKRLEDFPGQAESVLGAPVRGKAMPFVDLLRPVSELNRANPGNIFGTETTPSPAGITRTIPDISGSERLANYLVARSYSVDEVKQAMREQAMRTRAMDRLNSMLKQAYGRGDVNNARRIEAYIQFLNEHQQETPEVTQ